ncbi:MAG: hydantoinase/oxoprolinase family protein, partial [Desulfococcaceae bacterium]
PDRVGPAMAYGGESPTPTDALFALGKGTEDGDREAARAGVAQIAESLGVDPETAAQRIVDQACRQILDAARDMVDAINRKPVYTVHELREGHQVDPRRILILGGPAPYFADRLAELAEMPVDLVPRWTVANAVGAALARSTCEVSFFADTQREIATAPEEEFSESVDRNFSLENAVEKAFELLRTKALHIGAAADDLEMEVVERLQFNMVRGFYTAGRNIRVKVQVKPGLIHEYEDIARRLRNGDAAGAG